MVSLSLAGQVRAGGELVKFPEVRDEQYRR
jgi:hypothetical protein